MRQTFRHFVHDTLISNGVYAKQKGWRNNYPYGLWRTQVARGGSGAKAPPLPAHPVVQISGRLLWPRCLDLHLQRFEKFKNVFIVYSFCQIFDRFLAESKGLLVLSSVVSPESGFMGLGFPPEVSSSGLRNDNCWPDLDEGPYPLADGKKFCGSNKHKRKSVT